MSAEKQNGQLPGTGKAPNYALNQTLYITNIPSSKYQKEDLRRSLYTLFSTYGTVLDVVALLTSKMRGQAHVVFRDVQTATIAMRELQGFEFFGREMRIQYAKSKSDIIARLDGTSRTSTAGVGAAFSTELQQSIFNTLPSVAASLPPKPPGSMNVRPEDSAMGEVKAPTVSIAGQKRDRDEDEEPEEDSESDVAMEEDSDDD